MLKKSTLLIAAAAVTAAIMGTPAQAAPFGNEEDTAFAATLWTAMKKNRLVGANSFRTRPYEGSAPHGAILETIDGAIKVDGRYGQAIVKKNFGGDDIDIDAVADDPAKLINSVTVMFKREKGYNSKEGDWFWAKYTPLGEVMTNPAKMPLAGRVGTGSDKGCIACHAAAGGGDYVYNNDR